jgi:flagellar M-ring protein FliF
MAVPGNVPQQVASIWRQIGINQKLSILLVGVGSVVAVLCLVYWGGRPSYGLLYSRLSRKDAAAVVAQLDSDSIPYRLEDGGTTVLVRADQVQEARAKLVMQGLPSGGDGFEILDKRTLGMTDFAERKTYLRAVQGELARTISNIQPIEWARVHISAPEPSVFLDRDQPATASVLVKVRGGAKLSPTQVAAVASLVAGSVEGLEADKVTITDHLLNPLSRSASAEGPGSATAHLEAQRELERHLTKKVEDMLDTYLGPGRSTVSITADIALKQEEHRYKEVSEEGRVAVREKSTTSKSTGGDANAGGTAGTSSNLPGGGGGTSTGPAGRTESTSDEEIDYEVPTKEIVKVDNGVTINRLTVSVLVAGTRTVEKDKDGNDTRKFQPLPQAEVTKLTEAVKQAVGYDETRKDVVTVESVAFNEPQPVVSAAELASERRWEMIYHIAKQVSTVVVVLAFIVTAGKMLRKARAAREAAQAAAAEAREAAAAKAAAAVPPAERPLRDRVTAAVEGNPDAAADLLKTWYKGVGAGSQT